MILPGSHCPDKMGKTDGSSRIMAIMSDFRIRCEARLYRWVPPSDGDSVRTNGRAVRRA